MADNFRIPVDNDYITALGRALYNFTYLEWIVIWTIVKLNKDDFSQVPKGQPASEIAKVLIHSINNPAISLSSDLRKQLVQFHQKFLDAKAFRNQLLHAHPYTAFDGTQQLGSSKIEWEIEKVDGAARMFEEIAILGNDIFHSHLLK